MARNLVFITTIMFLVSSLMLKFVEAGNRVALVIGNSHYATAPLKNPVNDARDIAKVLEQLDFEVIAETDVNKRQMKRAIDKFAKKLKRAEIGLFYFAGHGMQINGSNYLIPVKVDVSSETDVEYEAVNAGRVIGKMRQADNKLNVVILDACRNNPFQRSFRSSSQGLAKLDAPKGTIIAYATGPGSVAADGNGRNGIFTKHLLSAMKTPNIGIQEIFNEAGLQVMAETNDQQIPWTSNTPIPKYYLASIVNTKLPRLIKPTAIPKKIKPSKIQYHYNQNQPAEDTSLALVDCDIGTTFNEEIIQMSSGACFASGGTEVSHKKAKYQVTQPARITKYKNWTKNKSIAPIRSKDEMINCNINTNFSTQTVWMSPSACVASGGTIEYE